jgi:hypothetical protein
MNATFKPQACIPALLGLAESWGEVDRSHRKLAHRGCYVGAVFGEVVSKRTRGAR